MLHFSTHSLSRLTFRQDLQARGPGPQHPSGEHSGLQTWPWAPEKTAQRSVWTGDQRVVLSSLGASSGPQEGTVPWGAGALDDSWQCPADPGRSWC